MIIRWLTSKDMKKRQRKISALFCAFLRFFALFGKKRPKTHALFGKKRPKTRCYKKFLYFASF
jgi:hypothetical protein